MTGLPSRVPKSCCWTPGFCFEEVSDAKSHPPVEAAKTIAHAHNTGLVIMAKSLLRMAVCDVSDRRLLQGDVRVEFVPAAVTTTILEQVDALGRVRRCHLTLIVLAMPEVERVSRFVSTFLRQSFAQPRIIASRGKITRWKAP